MLDSSRPEFDLVMVGNHAKLKVSNTEMTQCFTKRDAWDDTFRLCSGMHCAQASGIAKCNYSNNEPMLDSLLSEPTAASASLAAM